MQDTRIYKTSVPGGAAAPNFGENNNAAVNQVSVFYAGRLFGPYAEQNYQPASLAGEVLAAIALVGARETGEVTFAAPLAPGSYPFLCSFPAHCQVGMRGELVVK